MITIDQTPAMQKLAKQMALLSAKIESENKKFYKLSKPQQRVQIARDVLVALKTKSIKPETGAFLTVGPDDDLVGPYGAEVRDILRKGPTCEVCALGGMFVCAVERVDSLKMKDLVNDDCANDGDIVDAAVDFNDITNFLDKFFSMKQLEEIERQFEMGNGACWDDEDDQKDKDGNLLYFAKDVTAAGDRMRLIMENIIVNKGEFKPSKEPIKNKGKWVTIGFKG